MPVIAAIDIGSNAMRLVIATPDADGHYEVIHDAREPVRLGQDVFASGEIAAATLKKAVEGLGKFREQIDGHGVTSFKAVATSAVREATNGQFFVRAAAEEYDIPISMIGPEEEARLVHLAVKERIHLTNKPALLVDIGGGSVEVSFATHVGILSTESYAMGSVRLLQILDEEHVGEKRFNQLVDKYVDAIWRRQKREVGKRTFQHCIGTGGSIESIGQLRRELFGKNNTSKVRAGELDSMVKTLEDMTIADRIQQLHLRPDRADVIMPAAIVLQKIVQQCDVDEVLIPGVGVKEGLLSEIVSELFHHEKPLDYDQVMSSALQLGRKYSFDESHGVAVANLAVQIFDQTRSIHELDRENRVLLEVAALLHDIGQFVNASNHHKHTLYLLQASPVIGLTPTQMEIVSNVARYHRKSLPKPQHKNYVDLSPKRRNVVSTLAAILRVADALDREHTGNIRTVNLTFKKPRFIFRLKGEGDMMLAKWALAKRCDLFEEVFDGKLIVEETGD